MKRASPKRDLAEHFLRKRLAVGPQYQKSLEEKAKLENINIHTLISASKTLKIEKNQSSNGWQWQLPPNQNDIPDTTFGSYAPPPTNLSYNELRSWIDWSGATQDPTIKALLPYMAELEMEEQPSQDSNFIWEESGVREEITRFFNALANDVEGESELLKLFDIEKKLIAHLEDIFSQ